MTATLLIVLQLSAPLAFNPAFVVEGVEPVASGPVLVGKAPPTSVTVEVQVELTEPVADSVACPVEAKFEPLAPELNAVAKKAALDAFQLDNETRMLDGIGAIVADALEQLKVGTV
jgi:hypothetical protein